MRCWRAIMVVLVSVLAVMWQGCGGNGGGTGGGRYGNSGGNTATYLLYTDATANTIGVAAIGTSGALTVMAPAQTGLQPIGMAATPDGKFVYVLNANSGTVSQFAVAADGSLTQPASAIGTGLQPTAIAVDPQERFAVVANTNSGAGGTLSVYNINSTTGILTLASTSATLLNIADPKTVAISGNYVYVADADTIDVLVFNPQTFAFTFASGSPFSAGPAGTSITGLYSPPQASTVLYAADGNTNSLLSFSISGGALQATGSLPTGTQPVALVADNQNRFLFVANSVSDNISVFAVNATTGALTAASTTALTTGTAPNALAYDPVNNFLIISESGTKQILPLAVNTSTGGLSTLSGSMAVTNSPSALAVAQP
ncbi:MAG: beta-propeller fold lactonase family protein [Terriglobia bacterium]|nr:beta-propeller fold lactonase family protein [Terriglobia bacterium]